MLTKRGIEPTQVVSIATDGAPAMIGREKGAVARLKEDNPELIAYIASFTNLSSVPPCQMSMLK